MTTPMQETLGFPFMELNAIERAFGRIPNASDVALACPAVFYLDDNCWTRLAAYIVLVSLTDDEIEQFQIHAEMQEYEEVLMVYLGAWVDSRHPHLVKIAVTAWLLSLMLTKCPQVGQ
jgi:hypothetical protein